MPCAVDYILEGLAKNLELERELGNFSLEFDRAFLSSLPKERKRESRASIPVSQKTEDVSADTVKSQIPDLMPQNAGNRNPEPLNSHVTPYDFVFLHHGPIVGPGVEMMAKLIAAMKKTPENAPIVFTGEKPSAKIYIVLGAKALAKWYEGVSIPYCGWFPDVDSEVLLVYSPEEIYRFGTNLSQAMVQKKRAMWASLQTAMKKVKIED